MSLEEQIIKMKLNPPHDCPFYYNNWNCDDYCKDSDSYCSFDEFTGCPIYNEIFGIKMEREE